MNAEKSSLNIFSPGESQYLFSKLVIGQEPRHGSIQ